MEIWPAARKLCGAAVDVKVRQPQLWAAIWAAVGIYWMPAVSRPIGLCRVPTTLKTSDGWTLTVRHMHAHLPKAAVSPRSAGMAEIQGVIGPTTSSKPCLTVLSGSHSMANADLWNSASISQPSLRLRGCQGVQNA